MAQRKHPSSQLPETLPPKRFRRSAHDADDDDAPEDTQIPRKQKLPLQVADEPKYCYDVFLSFRGEDTRHGFTGHLYDALCTKGLCVFMDDEELERGESISPALLTAIQESKISIVVFSQNYASSTWCLEELVKILDCRNKKIQHVLPIFYKVKPSDVRHQRNRYRKAMTAHEDRFRNALHKVQEWRSALREASNLSGFEFMNTGYEYKFIERVANMAFDLLLKRLHIDEGTVGLQPRVEEVMPLLNMKSDNTVCMVGIHGIGGIGKTTLAYALYYSIVDQFEGACFLADVRERSNQFMGLVHLQETLLSKVLAHSSVKLSNFVEGALMIKARLRHRKVLLVLDDVNKFEQLEKLAGECDWFGAGSRIIITTRDIQLLNAHQVENRYEMEVLNDRDSLELFCRNAFKKSCPPTGYEDVSHHAVRFAKGLPLALKVIGSNLSKKNLDEWKCALNKYKNIPPEDIQSKLRISYDSLDDFEKAIFLDVACFFKGKNLEYVESILHACGYYPKIGIRVLVDKSLISIEGGELRMHDLIQDMGKEIVRQEAPRPGLRSRLCSHEEVIEVLSGNSGSSNIEGIMLDPPKQEEVEWSGTAFEKMENLRILIVKNARFSSGPTHLPNSLRLLDWKEYPSESFPPGFYPRKIVVFNLCCSHLRLAEPFKLFEYLTIMNFSDCEFITQIPDMSRVPNIRELKAQNCYNLTLIHDSVGYLSRLVTLDVSRCMKLTSLPRKIQMASLSSLCLDGCIRLDNFPDILGKMDALSYIKANNTAIEELPHSFGNLTGLSQLEMRSDTRLRELPSSLFMLQNLSWLHFKPSPHFRKSIVRCLRQLSFQFYRKFPKECLGRVKSKQESDSAIICCPKLIGLTIPNCGLLDADLQLILDCLPNLEMLYVSGNNFVSLPQCIDQHDNLRLLDVSNCKKLRHIPKIPSNLKKVLAQNCTSLTTESSSRLWSQVSKEMHELEIIMPETPIPDWFDHHCMGGTMSFSIRGKFPVVALAFSFGKGNVRARSVKRSDFVVSLHINGRQVIRGNHSGSSSIYRPSDPIEEGDTLLWTPRCCLEEEDWQELDALLAHDWNDVQIQAKCTKSLAVNYCAVYVYKPQTNMEDIQFKSFDPNDPSMVPTTSKPIKLKGSQADLERSFIEGQFVV